jgi:esterase
MNSVVDEASTGRCRSGAAEIFYRRFGRRGRTPLVFMHGLSFFSYDWIEPARQLAIHREAVAMDMRGFGDSGWADDYSIAANAGDVVALLDHLGWPRTVLIGHSMGGRHCTYCAAKNPGRIAGLVLVDWSPENALVGSRRVTETVGRTPDRFATCDEAMRYFGVDPNSPAGLSKRRRFQAYLKPVDGGFAIKRDPYFRDQFRRILETGERPKPALDMRATLAEVSCPILVIRGARSDMFAVESKSIMQAANPRLRLVEIDAGHNVAGDNLRDFVREVSVFLVQEGL